MATNHQREANIESLLDLLQSEKTLQNFRDAFENPDDLEKFARKAEFYTFEQGTKVLNQDDTGTDFFIVMNGQLRAVDVSTDPPQLLGYFSPGAIVGERVLLGSPTRTATVEVVSISAKLAFFNKDDWYWLLGKNSRFRTYFENLANIRLEQSAIDFPGRQWDEVVVAATKRHFVAFIAKLPLPLTLLIGPVLFFLLAELTGLEFLTVVTENLTLIATLPFILLSLIILVYNYFDWRNDDLIVTTKRVIHIERILFYGEQRRDAPLTRIQDVTFISDIWDVIFESEKLRITTAGAGVLEIDHIRRAPEIREAIFRERERAKARVAAADVAALRQNIAHQLSWSEKVEQNVMAVAEPESIVIKQQTTRHFNRLVDYFIPRVKEVNDTQEGTVILWRKHYVILLAKILPPILTFVISSYLFAAAQLLWLPPFGPVVAWPVQVGLGLVVIGSVIWYFWRYDDWNKDLYIVSNSQIIDIEASAFRLVRSRREGTFDNVQGVYSEVPNLFAKLVNMGNVIIETAGTQETFTFVHVYDPGFVNREIFNRMANYQQKEREKRRDSTNSQILEVLKEYHRLSQKDAPSQAS